MTGAMPWVVLVGLVLVALLIVGRWLIKLGGVLLRGFGAFVLLYLLQPVGIGLGANVVNALVVGVLGLPGVGLLFMLQWMFAT